MADNKFIKRSWRNWKLDDKGGGADSNSASPSGHSRPVRVRVVKKSAWHKIKDTHKSFIQSSKNIKGSSSSSMQLNKSSINNKLAINNLNYLTGEDTEAIRHMDNYDGDMNMAARANRHLNKEDERQKRINLGKSKSAFDLTKGLRARRLSTALATVVAKLAEDQNCEPIPGDDEWNVEDIMMRSISKRPITACRQSRERSNIVLLLDSSPSCEDQAGFYSSLAIGAVGMNILDVYDAPNGRVIRKFNYKIKRFEEFLSKDEIHAGITGWDYIKNRTIIFFGDYDGYSVIGNNSKFNKIYWFNPDYGRSGYGKSYHKNFDGTIFQCYDDKDFMKILKKLR